MCPVRAGMRFSTIKTGVIGFTGSTGDWPAGTACNPVMKRLERCAMPLSGNSGFRGQCWNRGFREKKCGISAIPGTRVRVWPTISRESAGITRFTTEWMRPPGRSAEISCPGRYAGFRKNTCSVFPATEGNPFLTCGHKRSGISNEKSVIAVFSPRFWSRG